MFRASPPSSQEQRSGRSRLDSALPSLPRVNPGDASFPIDLIRFSIEAEKRKKRQSSSYFIHYELGHAAPLISINHRDVVELDHLFEREDMPEICEDLEGMLARFMPAPCWEDCPFELDDWL